MGAALRPTGITPPGGPLRRHQKRSPRRARRGPPAETRKQLPITSKHLAPKRPEAATRPPLLRYDNLRNAEEENDQRKKNSQQEERGDSKDDDVRGCS